MKNNMGQALAEVYDIVQHMEYEMQEKISKKMIDFLDNHKDSTYKVNIDYSKSISEQELLQETRAILSILYRDYLCSKEEKEALNRIDSFENAMMEEEKRKKYEIKFPEEKIEKEVINEEKDLIKFEKEKWYEKIFAYIKKVFR